MSTWTGLTCSGCWGKCFTALGPSLTALPQHCKTSQKSLCPGTTKKAQAVAVFLVADSIASYPVLLFVCVLKLAVMQYS